MSAGPVMHRPRPASRPAYTPAAIHEGVRVVDLVRLLTSHGLTVSNVPEWGVVIHRIGQDPNRPAESSPG